MTVIRVHKQRGDFAVLPSQAINDNTLTWEARGMLLYLLEKPDTWEIRLADLINKSPAGRDQTRRILHELEGQRYVVRRRIAGARGHFYWESDVYETPQPLPLVTAVDATHNGHDAPSTENPSMVGSPSTGLPSMVQPSMVQPSMVFQSIYSESIQPERNTANTDRKTRTQQQQNGAGVVVDLSPAQQLAYELLLIAAPDFRNPRAFVQQHPAKLIGHWARYVSHHPDGEGVDRPAAFIYASVTDGLSAPEAGLFDVWWYRTLHKRTGQEVAEL